MSILREAAQQALEALEVVYGDSCDAIHALRAALAEPAAPTEPAPGWCKHCRQYTIEEPLQAAPTVVEPARRVQKQFMDEEVFYATPPRAALTREQAIALWADKSDGPSNSEIVSYCRAVEAAHGIGGTRNE